jgi:UDP-glucose 4-epimerase
MGSNLTPEYGAERKVNAVSRRLADVSKAKNLIGFEAEVSLEQGLEKLVHWWLSQKQTKETSNV